MFRATVMMASLVTSTPVIATKDTSPVSAFGVVLGRELDLPKCDKAFPNDPSLVLSAAEQSKFCAGEPYQLSDAPFQRAELIFPKDQKPELVSVNLVSIYIWQGKVEEIEFATPGHNFSDTVVAGLTAKFGRPDYTRVGRSVVDGIAFPSVEARWTLVGATVQYQAIDDLENGLVTVKTEKFDQVERAAGQAAAAKRTGL